MLREARREDKSEVYDLWKHAYPNQNRNYLNFYFKNLFDKGVCLLLEQDNRIVSSLQMNTHVIKFNGKRLMSGYILGVSTLPDYRRRGHMRNLMESAIDEAQHNHLFTMIKAFNPKLYEQFGFQCVYYHKQYTIYREFLHKVTSTNVTYTADPSELLEVYREFIRHFDGAYERDVEYYTTFLAELMVNQKKMLVYRASGGKVMGYVVYQVKNSEVLIKEAIYLESVVLMRLLKSAMGSANEVLLEVSQSEKIEKIFPMAIPKKHASIMVRINNFELFNKLFNAKATTVQEAYSLLSKPLWMHEYY